MASSAAILGLQRLTSLWDGRRWLEDRYTGTIICISGTQYFAIPKVACSSIMAAIVPVLGVDFPSGEWVPELFQTHKWDHLFERKRFVISKRTALGLPARWRFAFVRNPFDRLVSCYSEKIRADGDDENFVDGVSKVLRSYGSFYGGMGFEEFAHAAINIPDRHADPHLRSQYTFLINGSGKIAMDFVGRFERLPEDFDIVRSYLQIDMDIPHLLKSNRSFYRDYYSNDLRDKVAKRYARDLALFRYEF